MSFTLLGILNSQASAVAQAYFLSVLGGASSDIGEGIAIDSSSNIYVSGFTQSAGPGSNSALLVKYDSSAVVQWQRTLGSGDSERAKKLAFDSSDNVYFTGDKDGGVAFLTAKYDSSGTIQWQRKLSGPNIDFGNGIAIDSSNNIYVVGTTTSSDSNAKLILVKYNSSGTLQWQRVLGGADSERGESVAIDSADNVYVLGRTNSTGAGSDDFLLAKYDSSGSIQWQRILGGASFDRGFSVAIDSADNVYVLGQTNSTGAGSADFLLAKYDSSGSIQWQRILGGASFDRGGSVAIDSADNVYVLGLTSSTGAGSNDLLLAKYNSSGTIQYQRVLGGAGDDIGNSVAIDSSDNVYVLGRTNSTGAGGNDFLLAKLPNDGSLEGTYSLDGNNIIYQASTLTAATSSLTAGTSSLTASTSSLTAATSTLTDAAASLTVVTEEIG